MAARARRVATRPITTAIPMPRTSGLRAGPEGDEGASGDTTGRTLVIPATNVPPAPAQYWNQIMWSEPGDMVRVWVRVVGPYTVKV